jgi:hypothetical protein
VTLDVREKVEKFMEKTFVVDTVHHSPKPRLLEQSLPVKERMIEEAKFYKDFRADLDSEKEVTVANLVKEGKVRRRLKPEVLHCKQTHSLLLPVARRSHCRLKGLASDLSPSTRKIARLPSLRVRITMNYPSGLQSISRTSKRLKSLIYCNSSMCSPTSTPGSNTATGSKSSAIPTRLPRF